MKYIPERHHRRSIRLKDYDYSKSGAYYVTICTRNRDCILSKIDYGNVGAGLAPALYVEASGPIMRLTKAGEIAEKNWLEIPERFANVYLDEFVIMPNHIHGIIVSGATARVAPTVGQIIGSFKSKCVTEYLKHIKTNNINATAKMWQRNYYEHVIRNEEELNKTKEYIKRNPYRWEEDEENPDNIEKKHITFDSVDW
ncbi:MAG TPA: transposase [Thermodesulfobacteriota bacterium]|nr:transposase [Thermodesulfobacteriota bacterium]